MTRNSVYSNSIFYLFTNQDAPDSWSLRKENNDLTQFAENECK